MKKTTLTLLILSVVFVLLFYFALWLEGFAAVSLLLFTTVIGLVLLVLVLKSLFSEKNFLGAGLGVLALYIVVFSPIETIIESLKSPLVSTGYCEHTMSSASLYLRKNHSFEYINGGFLSNDIYEGTYIRKGDTVLVHFEKKHPTPLMDTLIYKKNWLKEIGNEKHNHEFKLTKNLIWK